jgi:type I restriction enzyme S subunit
MLPDGWTKEAIGNRVEIKHGFAFPSSKFNTTGDGYRLLTPGHFDECGGFREIGEKQKFFSGSLPNSYLLKKGDLLVAMTEQAPGLLGSSVIIPEDDMYLHNQRLGLVQILNAEMTSRDFLFHLFNADYVRKYISDNAGGTKVRHTSPNKIRNVPAVFPPKGQQEKIAGILNTWDRGIRLMSALIAAKLCFKQGLTQQLLTAKWRFREFKDEWKHVRMDDIAREFSERNTEGETIQVFSCTKYDGLVDSLKYFGKRVFSDNTANYKVVRRNDFAYATNHIEEGSIGLLSHADAGLVSPMYTVFRTNGEVVPDYLFRLLKTETYRQIFASFTSASVNRRGSLRWKQFATIPLKLPSVKEQRRINDALSVFDNEIELLRKELDALKKQKKGLMQKLLTGQVRVGAWQ